MKKLLLLFLIFSFIFSCENNKKENDDKSKRPKGFLEQWNVKGKVKSSEYVIYIVSEKFGEITKEGILEDPFFDSDEYLFPHKKSKYNKYGDFTFIRYYTSDNIKYAERRFKFNSDEIPISCTFNWEDQKERNVFKLDKNGYLQEDYRYNDIEELIGYNYYQRNKDGRIIKLSIFYNNIDYRRSIGDPNSEHKWKYDDRGNWIENINIY